MDIHVARCSDSELIKLGTKYGGWYVPKNLNFNENSVIYSGGAGEDISFDIKIQSKYNCKVMLIDPTEKANIHYNECIEFFEKKRTTFTGNIQTDYLQHIENETPNMTKITYVNMGLWDKADSLKFYRQTNDNYVSQSLIENMFTKKFDIVKVDKLSNIMSSNGHTHIDLLKLDIEGAEVVVLNKMLDEEIYPKYILVEFDLLIKNKDRLFETQKLMTRLDEVGYKILKNDKLNVTYIRYE